MDKKTLIETAREYKMLEMPAPSPYRLNLEGQRSDMYALLYDLQVEPRPDVTERDEPYFSLHLPDGKRIGAAYYIRSTSALVSLYADEIHCL